MAGERRRRILARLVDGGAPDLETKRLCAVCAEVTAMNGAGLMLMSGDVPRGSVCTTNDVSARIEQLQYALGEGPCVDAYQQDRPVLEPDLAHPVTPRWLAFTGPALEAGVRSIFGFPLQVGAVRLGALMADVAAQAILVLQANAPAGKLAAELEAGADLHYVVHQASGMVAAQLDVSVGHALIRLRAYAFGNDRPLTEVAQDVVARRLRFDARTGEKDLEP